ILNKHVKNKPCSRRPKKVTPEKTQEVLDAVEKNRYGRELSTEALASKARLSTNCVWFILRSKGLRKTKPTQKPGLTEAMKDAHLRFTLCYRH
ncbi:hypothetical protein K469DRAFT_598633, partial [Zopfia rhizophila CBS 207.26]